MTINQIIYSVFEGTGISNDDFPVSKRFVYSELKNSRTELIKQELNKNVLLDGNAAQTLSCFQMERVDIAECPELQAKDYILKSVKKLPEIIQSEMGLAIIDVYFLNGNPIYFKNRWKSSFRKKRRFQLNDISHLYLKNEHAYVSNYDDVDDLKINIAGYYSNPEDVEVLNNLSEGEDCEKPCKAVYDYEFNCPGHILRRIIEITRVVVFKRLGIPLDIDNNAKLDLNVQS